MSPLPASGRWLLVGGPAAALLVTSLVLPAQAAPADRGVAEPRFSAAVAMDVSPPLGSLPSTAATADAAAVARALEDRGPTVDDTGFTGDDALQPAAATARTAAGATTATIAAPLANFEGLSNTDNFNLFGFRVNPPDPVGDVGPNHYVEMVNLAVGVYSKTGTLLAGPMAIGDLWAGFAVEDCTDPSGDPIVVYDQFVDRWILSQFTTRGPEYYDCVAVSVTGDPTGGYYRYAFVTQPDPELPGGTFFPDYPKYGVWTDSYVLTTRDFGDVAGYGISVYALEKNKMVNGQPDARAVQFFLDSAVVPLNLVGDGLLPADVDGKQKPKTDTARPAGEVALDPDRLAEPGGAAAGGELRLDLPVRPVQPGLPAAARHHQPGPVPRHPVLPAAALLAAGLPKLQGLRGAGDDAVR
ncbi:MAG: hypothetical protein MUC45_08260 [Actinomycetia bacterium]|nr:hypothetical protein [Actinomycetes bacterium]